MATNDKTAGRFEGLGGKLIALVVLGIAAYILFKIVIGVVTAVAITAVTIIAVIAIIWALARLL